MALGQKNPFGFTSTDEEHATIGSLWFLFPKLTLTYFNFTGRAELLRLAAAVGKAGGAACLVIKAPNPLLPRSLFSVSWR